MIQEDYVSFEVAKLLREKGFDEECIGAYSETNHTITKFEPNVKNSEVGPLMYSAPTHQMAVAWLRKEKNILIYVYPVIDLPVKNNYTFYWRWDGKKKRHDAPHIGDKHNYESPEQATEAALKYSLENLI